MPEMRNQVVAGGTFVIGDEGENSERTELTTGQQLHNHEYAARMRVLNDKRRELGIQTECQRDPKTWDAIDLEYSYNYKGQALTVKRVDLERETSRIAQAVAFCSYCPLLAECKPLVEVATTKTGSRGGYDLLKVDSEGVIGGELIDSTKTARYVRDYLKTGEWSGWVKFSDGDES